MKTLRFLKNRFIPVLITVFFLWSCLCPVPLWAGPDRVTVALLGTADLRGSLRGYDYYTDCAADGGLTRLAALIQEERTKYPHHILVDAGNALQGTPLVNYYGGVNTDWIAAGQPHPMTDVFNQLHYDAWVLGNHDFNFGLDVLQAAIHTAQFPVLSANTLDTATGQTWEKVKPYIIKTFQTSQGDLKIGILGLTTPAVPSLESPPSYEGLQWADIVTDGSRWVDVLKNTEKVDAIIAVIHSGLGSEDPATEPIPYENEVLAFANANPEVTAILSGHTETELAERIGTHQIWTVQPRAHGENLEEILLDFSKDASGQWEVRNVSGRSLDAAMTADPQNPDSASVAEDPEIVALVEPYHQAALHYLQTKVGAASAAFSADGRTIMDTALIDLIQRVQMHYSQADLSAATPFSSEASIPSGDVTIGDISSLYTFENNLYAIQINGAQLRRYLEFSVDNYYRQYQTGDTQINKIDTQPDYNLDILEGADYTIDLTKSGTINADGSSKSGGESRITNLRFQGRDVRDNDLFTLALNSYRLNGGGSFLKAAGITVQTTDPEAPGYITFDSFQEYGNDGQLRNLIIRYFQEKAAQGQAVEPLVTHNWQTIPRFYNLVEITDTHGHLDNTPPADTPQTGAALLSGLTSRERQLYGTDRTLLLAGGDQMQGTMLSNVLQGKPVVDIMNQMNYDAMVLGNHDLDWGLAVLNQRLEQAQFPLLAANISLKAGAADAASRELPANLKPYVLVEKDGLTIGIIGVITPDTANIVLPAIVSHFDFQDPADTINKLVPEVKEAGADLVIVMAHIGDNAGGYEAANPPATVPLSGNLAALAQNVSGVAAILGGRSHTVNYDTVNGIPVVIGGSNGQGAAAVRLAVDAENKVMGAVPGYLDLSHSRYAALTPDPAVQAIVDEAKQEIGPVLNEVIGTAAENLPNTGTKEIALGNWMTDVLRSQAPAADFAFLNQGAIRTSLPAGPVTYGQIYSVLPFDNVVVTLELSGADILAILEQGVSGEKGLIQVSGLTFTYDPSRAVSHRIIRVTAADGTPLDPAQTYMLATNDFLGTGGDGYTAFLRGGNYTDTHILLRDALIADLKTRRTLSNALDGRARVTSSASPAEKTLAKTPLAEKTLRVTASALNLRTGPGLDYPLSGSLPRGTTVTLLAEEGAWQKIAYGGSTYYMYSQYLQPVGKITGTAAVTARIGLNLRAAAGLAATVLTAIPCGETVGVISRQGDWAEVIYRQRHGFVLADYLQ